MSAPTWWHGPAPAQTAECLPFMAATASGHALMAVYLHLGYTVRWPAPDLSDDQMREMILPPPGCAGPSDRQCWHNFDDLLQAAIWMGLDVSTMSVWA